MLLVLFRHVSTSLEIDCMKCCAHCCSMCARLWSTSALRAKLAAMHTNSTETYGPGITVLTCKRTLQYERIIKRSHAGEEQTKSVKNDGQIVRMMLPQYARITMRNHAVEEQTKSVLFVLV